MTDVELADNNILSNLILYDIIIVPVVSIVFFFISGRKFNNAIRLGYFLAIICIFTSLLHRLYLYTYVDDNSNSVVMYTNVMYVILTLEVSSFIGFGIFFLIGWFR